MLTALLTVLVWLIHLFENNILFHDEALTAELRRRQDACLAQSRPVTAAMVAQWPMTRRLLNNTVAMFGPVL